MRRFRRFTKNISRPTAIAEAVEKRILLSALPAGALDPAFGNGGEVTIPAATTTDYLSATAIAVQPDGDLIQVGNNIATRLLPNGHVDTTFGSNGTVALAGTETNIFIHANGTILFAGGVLEQLKSTGALDTSFGKGAGYVELPTGISAVAQGADGSIYAVTMQSLYAYNSDGSVRTSFGTSGIKALGSSNYTLIDSVAVAVDPQGRIDVAMGFGEIDPQGTGASGYGIERFATNGSVDLSFGTQGYAIAAYVVPLVDHTAIVVAPDGTIYQAGDEDYSEGDTEIDAIWSMSPAGVDEGGSAPGLVTDDGVAGGITSLALQPDGKLLAVGFSYTTDSALTGFNAYSIFVDRFEPASATSNGGQDLSFGGPYAYGSTGGDFGESIALSPNGDIVIAGVASNQPGMNAFTVTAISSGQVVDSPAQLTGKVIGTSGSYQNHGSVAADAFDGNGGTFFDAPTASGSWAGLDLGTPRIVDQIDFEPRAGWSNRLIGGVFQASNNASFSTGVVNLYTIASLSPFNPVIDQVNVASTQAYRYVRYIGPSNSFCNIAEAQFFGTAPAIAQLEGTVIGTSGSYHNQGNTITRVFDGNLSTFFDAPSASGNWVGLDLGSAITVTQIQYAPRAGWESRMVGGEIQASNSASFSSRVVTLFTITATPKAGTMTTQQLTNKTAYRYYRYIGSANSFCNIAELGFEG